MSRAGNVAASGQLEPGHLLDGKYEIRRVLGAGGMGCVYLAEHLDLGRPVAIKVVLPDAARDQNAATRLHLEARAAAAVGHRGIVDVLDVGWAEGSPYLVMEYLEGRSLADVLGRDRVLEPAALAAVAFEVASALAAAHAKGIVHRDLKPENIYIARFHDGVEQVKLLDFGLSKFVSADPAFRLTHTGVVLGTPYYMSPEQARGARDIDPRVDIWALGVVMYEALTGRVPYDGESYNELLAKILSEPYTRPTELNPSIPPGLEAIILRAMTKNRDKRYQQVRFLQDDLGHLRQTLPTPSSLMAVRSRGLSTSGVRSLYSGSVETVSVSERSSPRSLATTTPAGLRDLPRIGATTGLGGSGSLSAGSGAAAATTLATTGSAPSAKSRLLPLAVIGGVVALLGGFTGVLSWAYLSGQTATATTAPAAPAAEEPEPSTPAPAAAAAVAEEPPTRPSATPEGTEVTVDLSGVPSGAHIVAAGTEVAGPSFTLPRSDEPSLITVEVDGRVVVRQQVRPNRDVYVDLSGVAWPAADAAHPGEPARARPRPGRPGRPDRAPEAPVEAAATPPPAAAPEPPPQAAPQPEPDAPGRPGRPRFRGGDLPIVTDYPGGRP